MRRFKRSSINRARVSARSLTFACVKILFNYPDQPQRCNSRLDNIFESQQRASTFKGLNKTNRKGGSDFSTMESAITYDNTPCVKCTLLSLRGQKLTARTRTRQLRLKIRPVSSAPFCPYVGRSSRPGPEPASSGSLPCLARDLLLQDA